MEDLSAITTALSNRQPTDPMPVLFVGHGSPMNAIQDTPFSVTWNAPGNASAPANGHFVHIRPLADRWRYPRECGRLAGNYP